MSDPVAPETFLGLTTQVVLGAEGIACDEFSGRVKHFSWHDLARISVKARGSVPFLVLHLRKSAIDEKRKGFSFFRNPANIRLSLADFTDRQREALVDAIIARLDDAGSLANPFAFEREFSEKMASLSPWPVAVLSIFAINVAVFAAALFYGGNYLIMPPDLLLAWGANSAFEVQRGQFWRLLTSMFLHGNAFHIVINMMGLFFIGRTVEKIHGGLQTALLYIGSGLIGSAMSLHFSAYSALSLVASGAVFGLAGALIVSVAQHKDKVPGAFSARNMTGMAIFLVYSLVSGVFSSGVDNAAHIGGAVGGAVLAWLLPERFDMAEYVRLRPKRIAQSAALILTATVGVAALAPPATVDVARVIATAPLLERGLDRFASASEAARQLQRDQRTGKISPNAADDYARTVIAPRFLAAHNDFSSVVLLPNDPRRTFVEDMARASLLMTELFTMPAVYTHPRAVPQPANPVRVREIEKELEGIRQRLSAESDGLPQEQQGWQ